MAKAAGYVVVQTSHKEKNVSWLDYSVVKHIFQYNDYVTVQEWLPQATAVRLAESLNASEPDV